jgi:hypothetical protein
MRARSKSLTIQETEIGLRIRPWTRSDLHDRA